MIIDCGSYSAGVRKADATSVADAARLSREGPGFVWLAVSEPTAEELTELGASFDLPALAVEDALGIQAKSYKRMGLAELQEDTLRILRMNFPDSRYFDEVHALEAGPPTPENS